MRKKREFIEGATYHVTSRTNNKIKVFDNRLGRKIMLLTLEEAKEKYGFCLYNFLLSSQHPAVGAAQNGIAA
ncbi:transposase [Treponema sp. R80B11-R83G3]